jgi:molecular chaperone GrpE
MAEEKVQVPDGETEQTVTEEAQEQTTATEKSKSKTEKKSKKLEGQIAELERQLEEKNAEIAAQNDRYLRMMAEYDNFRKRSAKEREGIYADAYADALTSILPIIDNLERAVGFTEAEQVQKGVEMILKSAGDVLTKMGVEAFGAKGDIFDPNMHNAVMHIDDEEHKEGEIVEVFQKGYKKGDKIIRYAMVQTAN